jgi:hypothetical protein
MQSRIGGGQAVKKMAIDLRQSIARVEIVGIQAVSEEKRLRRRCGHEKK